MKTLTIRIDEDFEQQIRKRAAQKNIKFTRYLRSLIDRGLVVEMQLETNGVEETGVKNKDTYHTRLAEMLTELLIYSRRLVAISPQSVKPELTDEVKSIFTDVQKRAKIYIADLKLCDDKL